MSEFAGHWPAKPSRGTLMHTIAAAGFAMLVGAFPALAQTPAPASAPVAGAASTDRPGTALTPFPPGVRPLNNQTGDQAQLDVAQCQNGASQMTGYVPGAAPPASAAAPPPVGGRGGRRRCRRHEPAAGSSGKPDTAETGRGRAVAKGDRMAERLCHVSAGSGLCTRSADGARPGKIAAGKMAVR